MPKAFSRMKFVLGLIDKQKYLIRTSPATIIVFFLFIFQQQIQVIRLFLSKGGVKGQEGKIFNNRNPSSFITGTVGTNLFQSNQNGLGPWEIKRRWKMLQSSKFSQFSGRKFSERKSSEFREDAMMVQCSLRKWGWRGNRRVTKWGERESACVHEREREREGGRAELENRVIASSSENGLIVFTSTPLIVAIIRNTQNSQRERKTKHKNNLKTDIEKVSPKKQI